MIFRITSGYGSRLRAVALLHTRARAIVLAFASAALLAAAAGGCGDPPPSKYPVQRVHLEDTTLGPGDVFDVRVYQQPGMSSEYSVDSDGTISFPLIGVVHVAGKTPEQVRAEITKRLANGYLVAPQVSVLVKQYNSKKVSVFGQVQNPGTLPYSDGMTIIEAISRAGGFTGMARKNGVAVTRVINGKKMRFTVPVEDIGEGRAANFFVRPGDVVFVPQRLW